MIQNVLRHLGGIEAYGIISISLFFLTFMGMVIWAFRLKRPALDAMAALPLDGEQKDNDESETQHE